MKIKRIITFALAVLMLVSLLSGCLGKSAPFSTDSEGRFIYTICRSGTNKLVPVEDGAKAIRTAIKDNFDVKVTIIKDNIYEDFDENYEILVGGTDREESAMGIEMLQENRLNCSDDFIIAVINDKIVINAIKPENILVASEWFVEKFCKDKDSWSKLKKDAKFIYSPEKNDTNNTVANCNLGLFTVVLPKGGSLMAAKDVDKFTDYYEGLGYVSNVIYDVEPEEEYEILLGNCNREASKSVKVEGNNYIVKVVGTKIVIKGGNDLATNVGFNAFMKEVLSGTSFNWTDGFTINGKYDPNAEGAYTLNWNDEFEGSTVNLSNWGDYNLQSTNAPGSSSLGGKIYAYTVDGITNCPSNLKYKGMYVSDGCLTMSSERLTDVDFISGKVSTYWTMRYRYGVLEIQSRLPAAPTNVAYWVNGAGTDDEKIIPRFGAKQDRTGMTEIDMFENFGNSNTYATNIHRWWTDFNTDGSTRGGAHKSMDGNPAYTGNSLNNKKFVYDAEKYGGKTMEEEFHNYGFYWDNECMKFSFDGKVFCDYQYTDNESAPVHCLMNFLIISDGLGQSSYGTTYNKNKDGTYFEHKIDYVRLYQSGANLSQMITAWPQNQASGTYKVTYPNNPIGGQY